MTHPFFAAVQAAYDEHGLPPDVANVYLAGPNNIRKAAYWSIGLVGVPSNAHGCTVNDAYAAATAVRASIEAARNDKEVKAAARKLLADAGLSPDLVRE